MRIMIRPFALAALTLTGATATRAQIKPSATLSGSTPVAYKYPAPSSVTGLPVGPGAVRLSWTPVAGVSYYAVTGPGLPSGGLTVSGTTAAITGIPGPGMVTLKVAGVSAMTAGMLLSPPATQAVWVTGATPGFITPSLPTPSFQLTRFDVDEGAKNDHQARMATTTLALPGGNPSSCAYSPMVYFDGTQAPVPAAGWQVSSSGQVEPDSDPAYQKYSIVNGGTISFRAPDIPAGYVRPPTYNTWIFVVNCRNEYSNALQFRLYSPQLQLRDFISLSCHNGQLSYTFGYIGGGTGVGTASPRVPATTSGQRLAVQGTGFAGLAPTDQTVTFHLYGVDASGTRISHDAVAQPASPTIGGTESNERQIVVFSPDPTTFGMIGGVTATVAVTKGGKTTVSLPVSYYPSIWSNGIGAC